MLEQVEYLDALTFLTLWCPYLPTCLEALGIALGILQFPALTKVVPTLLFYNGLLRALNFLKIGFFVTVAQKK